MSRMSGGSMLRARRKDTNLKPNRRLDRKSSRGMIYENEELRLRTININAEVERGQSDIKKLRRENEQLRREIWSLRDEYDRLDKLLRTRHKGEDGEDSCSNSSNMESDEENMCETEDEGEDQESAENDENAQKTKQKGLHVNFDHLSIVSEENTNSDGNSATNAETVPSPNGMLQVISPPQFEFFDPTSESTTTGETVLPNGWDFSGNQTTNMKIPLSINANILTTKEQEINLPDHYSSNATLPIDDKSQSLKPKHFFSPINSKIRNKTDKVYPRTGPDVFVNNILGHGPLPEAVTHRPSQSSSSFQTGGNLEDLLMDIESISKDILNLQTCNSSYWNQNQKSPNYRSEINVVLRNPEESSPPPQIPESMVLLPPMLPYLGIGFENYTNVPEHFSTEDSLRFKTLQTQTSLEFPMIPVINKSTDPPASQHDILRSFDKPVSTSASLVNLPVEDSLSAISPLSKRKIAPTSPILDINRRKMSAASTTSEITAQNNKNTIQAYSPATRKKLYDCKTTGGNIADNHDTKEDDADKPNEVIESPNSTRKMSTNPDSDLHRNESLSSSSERNEHKVETPRSPSSKKKPRRVSIYFNKKNDILDKKISRTASIDSKTEEKHSTRRNSHDSSKLKDSKRSTKSRHSPDQVYTKGGKVMDKKIYIKSNHDFPGSHGSMYSTQESCPEPMTSHSERNSLASSRESSTSLSMRSQKSRKMSSSSGHTGAIPWCGCWGNGCL